MPWCDNCGHEVTADLGAKRDPDVPSFAGAGEAEPSGRPRCPACGTALGQGGHEPDEEVRPKAPWHFKVLVVGSVGYLGYRLYQGIGWLIHHG